jgi:hypothetical protein
MQHTVHPMSFSLSNHGSIETELKKAKAKVARSYRQ